ncbi:MAG TPA: fumarylacetoacetate hydrolase family protein [Anaerolineales bacterium]|jgi:fumarylacetoacetate (FAA) hydrolase|nr:fumarylacetoacetate hydrolase family protein [Anaerolineales bacterium]
MKFATVSTLRATTQPALVVGDRVHTLPYPDMLAVIAAGAEAASKKAAKESLALDEVKFLSPLKPNTLRDGYAFEQHVKTANKNRGREVPEEWYQFPVFYFTNPNTAFGHDDTIPYPHYTQAMDYELEIAAIIGTGGMNIKAEDAEKHIFGYTIFNDWSARDVQRKEMVVGLGPAKGKDFASAFGPVIVTREAIADKATGKSGVYDLEMVARVNGKELSRGNWKDMHWSFGDIIARASDSVMLNPGDVIGSGTVGTGCLLELTKFQGPWLNEGDVVELEVERIGVLKNTVGMRG